jgi:hypothetical protein
MRRPLTILLLPLTALLLNSWPAGACGDKLLILGLGVRFAVDTADSPAWILLYANPAANSTPFQDEKLRSIVEKAGHRLRSVTTKEDLASALKTGRYDLVLADFADAGSVEPLIETAPSNPTLLPWIYQATKTEGARADKQYPLVLKAPASVGHFLSVVDRTMEKRAKLARLRTDERAKKVSFSK